MKIKKKIINYFLVAVILSAILIIYESHIGVEPAKIAEHVGMLVGLIIFLYFFKVLSPKEREKESKQYKKDLGSWRKKIKKGD